MNPERCLCDPQIHAQVGCPSPECRFATPDARLAVEVARSLDAVLCYADARHMPGAVLDRAVQMIRLAFKMKGPVL